MVPLTRAEIDERAAQLEREKRELTRELRAMENPPTIEPFDLLYSSETEKEEKARYLGVAVEEYDNILDAVAINGEIKMVHIQPLSQ